MHTYIDMHIHMQICLYRYIHVFIHMYTYMYTYVDMHICIHAHSMYIYVVGISMFPITIEFNVLPGTPFITQL